ncbi:deoxyadenosine/deoxycytidine kinase [Hypnocyclicus thermotrophus]|uniref:Deoxyadenosine/deoxycytidine kinase n=2 Tax=Hypnocyclicus thermotrophus TaxID=1627895 RepID=A0AA46I6D5_9FUSO|nr:deoxyadenosine/deoxycytidine kinase [Hypnocyclicus thermotrophus]
MIFIDGVVGAGKSTLAKILADELNIPLYKEPVFENPILDKFYHNKKKYSFPLQIFLLNKRLKMVNDAMKTNGVFDRSIFCDIIFANILTEDGDMLKEELELYKEVSENLLSHITLPELTIYLEISTDNAINRIKQRGRDFELLMPRDYWEKLNIHYRNYFKNYNKSKLLIINVDNLDIVNNEIDRKKILEKIKKNL